MGNVFALCWQSESVHQGKFLMRTRFIITRDKEELEVEIEATWVPPSRAARENGQAVEPDEEGFWEVDEADTELTEAEWEQVHQKLSEIE